MSKIITKKKANEIADILENYVALFDNLFILESVTKEDAKKAKKNIKKAVKDLREGKIEKVFDMEKVEECALNDENFRSTWINPEYYE